MGKKPPREAIHNKGRGGMRIRWRNEFQAEVIKPNLLQAKYLCSRVYYNNNNNNNKTPSMAEAETYWNYYGEKKHSLMKEHNG